MEEFTPEESEDRLYHLVSEYLRRDNLQALPASQRSLMTLVLRKLLASSTFAIAIEGGPAYPLPVDQAIHGIAVFEAITRSAASGRPETTG